MRVPTAPNAPTAVAQAQQGPSPEAILMAMAEMRQQYQSDIENKPADAKDWLREKDIERKKDENLKGFYDPNNTKMPITPGTDLPDTGQGGTARRKVKGT